MEFCTQLGVSGNLWPSSVILKCPLITLNPYKHNLIKHSLTSQKAAQNNKEHWFLPCGLGLYDFRVDRQVISYNFVEKGGMSLCAYITSCCKRQEQTVSL